MSELTIEPQDSSVPYQQPAIVRRETIAGLLGSVGGPSDGRDNGNTPPSDVNIKENIIPVRW